jgi:hypothetical protein
LGHRLRHTHPALLQYRRASAHKEIGERIVAEAADFEQTATRYSIT